VRGLAVFCDHVGLLYVWFVCVLFVPSVLSYCWLGLLTNNISWTFNNISWNIFKRPNQQYESTEGTNSTHTNQTYNKPTWSQNTASPLTHSVVDHRRWRYTTADDHSIVSSPLLPVLLNQLNVATTTPLFYVIIHCLLGLPWWHKPSTLPSKTVSAKFPALPLVTCLPYNLYYVSKDVKHCSIQSNTWSTINMQQAHKIYTARNMERPCD